MQSVSKLCRAQKISITSHWLIFNIHMNNDVIWFSKIPLKQYLKQIEVLIPVMMAHGGHPLVRNITKYWCKYHKHFFDFKIQEASMHWSLFGTFCIRKHFPYLSRPIFLTLPWTDIHIKTCATVHASIRIHAVNHWSTPESHSWYFIKFAPSYTAYWEFYHEAFDQFN